MPGFGIKSAFDVKNVCKIAEGAVVGSSIIKIIENNLNDKTNMIEQLGNFVKDLKEGTKK